MEKPFYLIKRHPLKSFFIITFASSWIMWFLAPMISLYDERYQSLVQIIGMYAPVLTAMLIARIQEQELENSVEKYMVRRIVFIITFFSFYFFSLVYFHYQLNIGYESKYFIIISVLTLLNAQIISNIFSESGGIAKLLAPLVLWKVKRKWYFISLLLPPLMWTAGLCFDLLLGAELRIFVIQGSMLVNLRNFCVSFFTTFLFGGPLNEEAGWRGFALCKLQQKYSPLKASILLGTIWSIWHIPLHVTGFYDGGIQPLLVRFLWNIPIAVIFTWIFNKARQSLLVVMLLHTSVNTTSFIVNFSPRAKYFSIIFMAVFILFITFRDKMYEKDMF